MLEKDFLQFCDQSLQDLLSQLEKKDKNSALDVDYADGILTIEIERTAQTYVINRNSASQKIWYSSPLSGASYFSFDEKNRSWIDGEKNTLAEKLFAELQQLEVF